MTGKLKHYLLKLDEDLWKEIDENRLAMTRLFPSGVSKKEYIQNALISYGKSFEEQARPKLDRLAAVEIEEPFGIWYDNGLDQYEKF